MKFAICHNSVVPVRNSTSNRSEQVSQLLFGEMVEILETKGKLWTKIRCTWDNCIGWVVSRQIKPITSKEYNLFTEKYAYCLDLFQPLMSENESMPICIGSRLPDFDGMKFKFDGKLFNYSGQAVFPENLQPQTDKVLKIAKRYLSAPYQWGGRSPMGIDSGGFTQMVFKLVGIKLLRTTDQQVFQGELIDFIEQALPGDLAFFENKVSKITHVGILLPGNLIIHTAEKVRIDKIDHYGIYCDELQKYTHRLRVIKRIMTPLEKSADEKIEEKDTVGSQVALFD
ncbi:MAG: SH3 domain-containing C40 family peptidase [Bacteroidota bacterium]